MSKIQIIIFLELQRDCQTQISMRSQSTMRWKSDGDGAPLAVTRCFQSAVLFVTPGLKSPGYPTSGAWYYIIEQFSASTASDAAGSNPQSLNGEREIWLFPLAFQICGCNESRETPTLNQKIVFSRVNNISTHGGPGPIILA